MSRKMFRPRPQKKIKKPLTFLKKIDNDVEISFQKGGDNNRILLGFKGKGEYLAPVLAVYGVIGLKWAAC